MFHPRSILITGASSGIGQALAQEYAGPGITLTLTGRDEVRLAQVAQFCRGQGANVETRILDVVDAAAMRDVILRADRQVPLDLVIANAGMSERIPDWPALDPVTRKTFATNVDGVFNTLFPAIDCMLPRGRGQLGIVASLAAFRGLPGHPAYCASKAAVKIYGEALRGQLAPHGIGLSVICPGYIRTPMTAKNRFPMPFLMDAAPAARLIRRQLAKNRGRIAFPRPFYALVWFLSSLPDGLVDKLTRRLPRK